MHDDGLRLLTLFTHARRALEVSPIEEHLRLDLRDSFFSEMESLELVHLSAGLRFDTFVDWLKYLATLRPKGFCWVEQRIYDGVLGCAAGADSGIAPVLARGFCHAFLVEHATGVQSWIGAGTSRKVSFLGGEVYGFQRPVPLPLDAMRARLVKKLDDIGLVCREAGAESYFVGTFGVARSLVVGDGLEQVTTRAPESPFLHMFPADAYPPEAQMLAVAAQNCQAQFGGMGSWNDTTMALDSRCQGLFECTEAALRAAAEAPLTLAAGEQVGSLPEA